MNKSNTGQEALSMKLKTTTTPCCTKLGIKKGPWTPEEDELLANYVNKEGEGRWRTMPKKAGLLRCGKSCRLRWMNYLRPCVKRGRIAPDEEDLILRLHRLLGNRWALIAGRIPGRTDNEIKNYWNTHLSKKLINQGIDPRTHKPLSPNPKHFNQDAAPKTAQYYEEIRAPYRVTATKLNQNIHLMTNQLYNDMDDHIHHCQIPALNNEGIGNWPSRGEGLPMGSQSNAAAYCTENIGNEDHNFSSFLDSLINENEYLLMNQQQQIEHEQPLPNTTTTEVFNVPYSAA